MKLNCGAGEVEEVMIRTKPNNFKMKGCGHTCTIDSQNEVLYLKDVNYYFGICYCCVDIIVAFVRTGYCA